MIRVAVLVPGIMGSKLFYGTGSNRREVWGDNFLKNYREIIKQPAALDWNGTPAAATELLTYVYTSNTSKFLKLPKYRLWDGVIRYLKAHPEFGKDGQIWEYSYDWRDSLINTADTLGQDVDKYTEDLAEKRGVSPSVIRYVFLTHSMGGLVVRIALARGALHPSAIDRIVHIGTPLEGSASAFRSAYRTGGLPLMQTLYKVFESRKNAPVYFQSFLKSVRSFPSVYQLMPPQNNDYLIYPRRRSNPLKEKVIHSGDQAHAAAAHQALVRANQILQQGIRIYTIYSEYHTKHTDLEYEVEQITYPNARYEIMEPMPYGKTNAGDGTVPMLSAQGNKPPCIWHRVTHADHTTMCNDEAVIDQLPRVL